MPLNTQAIVDALASHAAASGYFERVNGAEVIHAQGNGLTTAVWVQRGAPAPAASGLAATSVRFELHLRIYASANQQPRDAIDPAIMAAVDQLMADFSGDFSLGGLVRNVDLLGAHGQPLQFNAGYLDMQGVPHRVVDMTVPMIISDAWAQSP